MKIQLINYSGENDKKFDVETVNSFGSPMSLDSFDLNILDLTASEIWQNKSSAASFQSLSVDKDFTTLRSSIRDSNKSSFLYLLPRNIPFCTSYGYIGRDSYGREIKSHQTKRLLKDILTNFSYNIQKISEQRTFDIYYERTITTLIQSNVEADFYFQDIQEGFNKIYSNDSNKLVNITMDRYTYTTLQINNNEALQEYLNKIFVVPSETESVPDWFNDITFFDDAEQKELIEIEKQKIEESKKQIKTSREIINQNKYFESILYKTGEPLEEVLREMLQEMFDVKTDFIDNNKEDYVFEKDGIHYIFEFKGLTKELKKSNIGQLRNHAIEYSENFSIDEENTRCILIANRFLNVEPSNREKVHPNIVDFAKIPAYSVVIIDSADFLKLFERFRTKGLSSQVILNLFEVSGLLVIE